MGTEKPAFHSAYPPKRMLKVLF